MSIHAITRTEFDKFKPWRLLTAEMLFEEVEWFADDKDIVIGVITLHRYDKDWAVAVLGRDERRDFRAVDNQVSIETLDEAHNLLIGKMEKALASGKTVFPQGD